MDKISDDQLIVQFQAHVYRNENTDAYERLRSVYLETAKVVRDLTPSGGPQDTALGALEVSLLAAYSALNKG